MSATTSYRLEGLESDNLLAFLALLGLLRALEAADRERPGRDQLRARAAWDIDTPPLRPRVFLFQRATTEELTAHVDRGLEILAAAHGFGGRKDLNQSRDECRALLSEAAMDAARDRRDRVDVLAALMTDAAIKDQKKAVVDPTPLCVLFGQGHQHFLERLASVPRDQATPSTGKGKNVVRVSSSQCLADALFRPWHRSDLTFSFRWDPEEDVRYALLAGDPTDPLYQAGTQHGANRLAAVGLGALTLAPESRAGRVRPTVVGGKSEAAGFSLAWPIWRETATLSAIRALLAHPDLRKPGGLAHLGVDHVLVARRISVGQFMNFSRARALDVPRPRQIAARRSLTTE